MPDQPQRPPYPPAPPYPPGMKMPPRPAGVPPYPPGVKMPAGMKMPPRPMGAPPYPPGMKMPPRPMGAPPMGGAMPPAMGPVPPQMPSFPEEEYEEPRDLVPVEEADENGFIDDLADEVSEPEPAPVSRKVVEEEEEPDETDDFDEPNPYEHNMASDFGLPPSFVSTKVLLFLFFLFLAVGGGGGYFVGMLQNEKSNELPGVVSNSEIPKGRPRCGIAQKGQGCVLYLMNAQRREIEGRDLFARASEILGIPKFQIETANIRYATVRIPPGYIALLNIPPVQ